jgi:hypothetical protein
MTKSLFRIWSGNAELRSAPAGVGDNDMMAWLFMMAILLVIMRGVLNATWRAGGTLR